LPPSLRARPEELLVELRRALHKGVPRWLATAVGGCIEELERATAPMRPSWSELEPLRAQAETLLALCKGSWH
jgi:hypothetical protein